MLAFLKGRAIDGVEWIEGETYCRTVLQDGLTGTVEISHLPKLASLTVTIRFPSVRALPAVVGRIRRVFDLGADVAAIGAHLAQDPLLAPLIAARPGLRAPGGWDGFELAVRAVLGQQVTVEAGRQLAGKLAQICGTRLKQGGRAGLIRAFPTAAQVAKADLSGLGMPGARKEALVAVAEAALSDPALFHPQGTIEATIAR